MSETAENLYRALVVERARRPLHAGEVAPADGAADGSNPLCGDRVHVTLRRGDDARLAEIRHTTRGCAICIASADLMAESATGLDDAGLSALWRRFDALLREGEAGLGREDGEALGLLNAFADLHEYRSRRKCATLPWSALLAAAGTGEGS